MSGFYRQTYRHFWAHLDPERAHRWGLAGLRAANCIPGGMALLRGAAPRTDARLAVQLWERSFANPLGLAAGLDKDAQCVDALFSLGFGHVEVGTITPRAQPGNPAPRLWRVPEAQALINALGFPSGGVAVAKKNLERRSANGILGINIGMNKDTPLSAAGADYARVTTELNGIGDYLTINVSSPNTPGLRSLQQTDALREIIKETRHADVAKRPVLIKLSPDLDSGALRDLAQMALDSGVSGIIATNTTIARDTIDDRYRELPGGLSGAPLRERSLAALQELFRVVGHRIPLISVGGISTATDVLQRMRAGASLVQLYTAFIYEGPVLPKRILRDLSRVADAEGWSSIQSLVGTAG